MRMNRQPALGVLIFFQKGRIGLIWEGKAMNHINEKCKILTFAICTLQLAILVSGCTAFYVGGEIQKGRMALLYGDPKVALAHFQRAAELDPNYVTNFTILKQGVWTYVARANYTTGNLSEARKELEQARSKYEDDNVAKLYWGLLLAKDGDRQRALREMEAGLTGLKDWFDYIEQYHADGQFWDPGRPIRSEIQKNIAMLSAREVNWNELIAGGEWLGRELEQEIDKAREDQQKEDKWYRDGDGQMD